MVEGEEFDYITRTVFNRGIWGVTGVIDEQAINLPMTFSLELMNCTFFYREKPWYAGQFVKKIIPLNNEVCVHWRYFEVVLNKLQAKLKSVLVRDVDDTFLNATICLPIKRSVNDITHKYHDIGLVPDWEYMQKYVSKIEEETRVKVDKYLSDNGLNSAVSEHEKQILTEEKKFVEFKIGRLFTSQNGNFDIQQKHINNKGVFVVTSGVDNYGIAGKSDIVARIFNENTITVDMFGNAFLRDFPYKMVTHARVFSLEMNVSHRLGVGLYLQSSLRGLSKAYSYGNMCSFDKIKNDCIHLPIKNNVTDPTHKYHDEGYVPDWDYMEKYIDVLMRQTAARVM